MDSDSPFLGFASSTNQGPRSPQLEIQESMFFEPEIPLTSTTGDQAISYAHISPILEETSQEISILKESEGNSLRKVNKGVNMQSLSFGPTLPWTKTHWILLDTHRTELRLVKPYQLFEEESLTTKLIISAALLQDNLSMKFSNSWNKLKLQSTKLFKGTQTSKKDYEKEEATKSPSTSKNKPLIPQSKTDTRNPILMIPLRLLNTYPMTLTRTNFIMTRNIDTSTMEEYLQDSLSKKEPTATTTGHFSTRRSVQGQSYLQLNSSKLSQGSNSKSLNDWQIGIIEHQEHTFITYPGKQPVEVESLEEILPLHPPYKKHLPKQAFTLQHQSKNPLKSILQNKIQIENLLTIWSPQPIQCWQILEILDPRDQLWPNPPPSMETESEQNNSSMKSTWWSLLGKVTFWTNLPKSLMYCLT